MAYATRVFLFLIVFLGSGLNTISAQKPESNPMLNLDFMIGNWLGMSTTYGSDGSSASVPAYESIQYGLDQHIVTIDLKSETLVLHTVITYDIKDETYYYHPFSKKGSGKYPASFEDGKLIVRPNDETRYIFTSTAEGNFTEYGEKLVDGKWVKTFEDVFERID